MSGTGRKKVRSTSQQLNHLADYMLIYPMFAAGEYRGPLRGSKVEEQWERLRQELSERGPDKTVEQWKQTWRDLKKKARNENASAARARNLTGNVAEVPEVSEISQKVLSTIGQSSSTGFGPMESGIGRAVETPHDFNDTEVDPSENIMSSQIHLLEPEPVATVPVPAPVPIVTVGAPVPTPTGAHLSRREGTSEELVKLQRENNMYLKEVCFLLKQQNEIAREKNRILKRKRCIYLLHS